MKKIKIILIISFIMSFAALVFLDDIIKYLPNYHMGGDFSLTSKNNKRFDISSLRGNVILLFFGYTSCPEICPTTIEKLKQIKKTLSYKANKVKTVFITLDPERDTPKVLKEYLDHHDPNTIGLTGTSDEIKSVANQFDVSYHKDKLDNSALGYVVDHSTYLYLIDQKGDVRHIFSYTDEPNTIVSMINTLLNEDK